LLAFACLLANDVSAGAHDPDLPAIDPPGQGRVMTHDDASSTSKCIGNPITPLCAVETDIACFTRKNNDLCRIAMGLDSLIEFYRGQPIPDVYYRYRVLSAKRFTEQNLPPPRQLPPSASPPEWWYTEDRRQYRPGDVEIVVLKQYCRRNPDKCNRVSAADHLAYDLRRKGASWSVLMSHTPDPRLEKIRPEKF
jgi:hypothetical protein